MKEVLPPLSGISTFRLQMFLPLCGLSGFLPRNLGIVDVAFPADGRGSHKSLKELGVSPDRFGKYFSLICNHFGVDPRRTTWAEMMCCEKRTSRDGATDVFIMGQSLSMITIVRQEYHLWVKDYSKLEWRRVIPDSDGW
jgi:hypothetical protein